MSQYFPQNVHVHSVVTVNQSITKTYNLSPENSRMLGLRGFGYAACRFTNDFQQTNQGKAEDPIGIQVLTGVSFAQSHCLSGMIEHVSHTQNIVMVRHIALRPHPTHALGNNGSKSVGYSGQPYAP